jgi:acetyltransferase-like isoleucine patch superfamily enzyme
MLGLKRWIRSAGAQKRVASWMPLSPTDHAFANGPVFQRPASAEDAVRMLQGDEAAAEMLVAVFAQFDEKANLASGVRLGLGARLINLNAREQVTIGANSVIRGVLRNERAGRLFIGERIYIGDNALVSSALSIEIGNGTLLAHGAQIFDNDSHPVDVEQRAAHFRAILGDKSGPAYTIASAPVRIGQMAWIGLNAIVMKGVSVGDEVIVGAGAVVTRDVAARTVVGGNPAIVVKQL